MFDGDVLNIIYIINEAFYERCKAIFNPRNAMYISRNDGKFNSDLSIQRDTVICANTLMNLGNKNYTKSDLDNIRRIVNKNKKLLHY